MKALLPIFILLFIASCNEGRSIRLRPADIKGVTGLETEEFMALRDYVASTTNGHRPPQNSENIEFNVHYNNIQIIEFLTLDEEGEEVRCRYEYEQAALHQEISVVTTTNEEDETKAVSRVESVSPKNAIYAGVPYIEAEKTLCDLSPEKLITVGTPIIVDLEKNHLNFKAFLKRQIIDLFLACTSGLKINGSNCLAARVDKFIRTESPVLIYNVITEFDWMAPNGSRSTTLLSLEFSPTLINFSPTGILNLNSPLVRPIQNIAIPYSNITLQDINLSSE